MLCFCFVLIDLGVISSLLGHNDAGSGGASVSGIGGVGEELSSVEIDGAARFPATGDGPNT